MNSIPPILGRLVLATALSLLAMCLPATAQTASEAPATNRTAATFEVRGYAVAGSSILSTNDVARITSSYTGPAVDLQGIRKALAALVTEYRRRGFATVGVTLPPQQLTNGIVQVQATEGRLAEIAVAGNKHFSEANIRRALPSLETNVLLNTHWFQPELDQANGNADRQIYPVIGPGPEPGTSTLTLKVKDRLPLHGHVEVNNRATPGTPPLRVDTAVQYNNLWQRDHQVGFQYGFSPQELKNNAVPLHHFFDTPRIANYSGFYRLPIETGNGAREEFERQTGPFGYDPVRRSFQAPAASGNTELIFFASRSASETPLHFGALETRTNNAFLSLATQTVDQSLTWNENIGTRLTLPVWESGSLRSSLSLGTDFKIYHALNFSTNLTYISVYGTNSFGNRELVYSDTIPFDSNTGSTLFYLPLAVGWSGSRSDSNGVTFLSLNTSTFLSALASGDSKFKTVAGSPNAGGNFVTVNVSLVRDQKLPRNWLLSARLNGQWASTKVIPNEQFGLGGTAGVRGYEEGEQYGDSGWRLLLEPKTPPIGIGQITTEQGVIPITLRGTFFLDYGERYLYDTPIGVKARLEMLGAGVGAVVHAGQTLEGRLTLAWALLDTPASHAGNARAYFSLGAQF